MAELEKVETIDISIKTEVYDVETEQMVPASIKLNASSNIAKDILKGIDDILFRRTKPAR